MITLPMTPNQADNVSTQELGLVISLVKNELNRMYEFKSISLNPYDADKIIDGVKAVYGLNEIEEFEDIAEYHMTEGTNE